MHHGLISSFLLFFLLLKSDLGLSLNLFFTLPTPVDVIQDNGFKYLYTDDFQPYVFFTLLLKHYTHISYYQLNISNLIFIRNFKQNI